MEATILESCHSTWIFDTDRLRFRRVLKDITVGQHAVTTTWRPYSRIDIDPSGESFVVILNAAGSRLIRSWRHSPDCAQCAGRHTTELSLQEIREAISA
jgi:hypothetical protein